MSIYVSSDLHFQHDRSFIWSPRGFNSIQEMNETIIENFNNTVSMEDDLWLLGDICLGGASDEALSANKALIESLNGRIHIVRGNHDTDKRIEMYKTCKNVVEVCDAKYLKYGKYHFFLTHFPCISSNLEKESLQQCTLNLSGHTHSKERFYLNMPFVYNVACDAHNCTPALLDDIIQEMKEKVKECLEVI